MTDESTDYLFELYIDAPTTYVTRLKVACVVEQNGTTAIHMHPFIPLGMLGMQLVLSPRLFRHNNFFSLPA